MRIIIENETLRASIESKGAELVSLIHRPSGCEIIWQPESGQWQGRSPILFPIVGGQKNGYYTYDGRRYEMVRHGFAMEREFCCDSRGTFYTVFSTEDDSDTRERYPFSFCLKVRFVLDQNTLQVVYSVENHCERRMPYCIGGHTAYRVPLVQGTQYDDYRIEWEKRETAPRYPLIDGVLDGQEQLLKNSDALPLSFAQFNRGALVFKDLASRSATIKGKGCVLSIQVAFPDFSYLALWNLPGQEFICIEPWQGCTSSKNDSQAIQDKDGIRFLDPNERADYRHSILVQ